MLSVRQGYTRLVKYAIFIRVRYEVPGTDLGVWDYYQSATFRMRTGGLGTVRTTASARSSKCRYLPRAGVGGVRY